MLALSIEIIETDLLALAKQNTYLNQHDRFGVRRLDAALFIWRASRGIE
jgi:hypothetical protein